MCPKMSASATNTHHHRNRTPLPYLFLQCFHLCLPHHDIALFTFSPGSRQSRVWRCIGGWRRLFSIIAIVDLQGATVNSKTTTTQQQQQQQRGWSQVSSSKMTQRATTTTTHNPQPTTNPPVPPCCLQLHFQFLHSFNGQRPTSTTRKYFFFQFLISLGQSCNFLLQPKRGRGPPIFSIF